MANSGFIVINSVHNNDHGESVLLVSSLCFNRSPGCGSHICCCTHGWPKVSFHFQSCLLVSTMLNHLVSLSQTVSSYARLFVNSALCIDCCQKKLNYPPSAKYEHVQNHSNLFEHEENDF